MSSISSTNNGNGSSKNKDSTKESPSEPAANQVEPIKKKWGDWTQEEMGRKYLELCQKKASKRLADLFKDEPTEFREMSGVTPMTKLSELPGLKAAKSEEKSSKTEAASDDALLVEWEFVSSDDIKKEMENESQ